MACMVTEVTNLRYYKVVSDGYIVSVGTGNGGTEIIESEYTTIMSVIQNRPDGDYALKEDLTWEIVSDVTGPEEEELSPEEIAEALEEIL